MHTTTPTKFGTPASLSIPPHPLPLGVCWHLFSLCGPFIRHRFFLYIRPRVCAQAASCSRARARITVVHLCEKRETGGRGRCRYFCFPVLARPIAAWHFRLRKRPRAAAAARPDSQTVGRPAPRSGCAESERNLFFSFCACSPLLSPLSGAPTVIFCFLVYQGGAGGKAPQYKGGGGGGGGG